MKIKFLRWITRVSLIIYRKSLHRDLLNKLNKTKKLKKVGGNDTMRMNRIDNAVSVYRKNPEKPPVQEKNNIIDLQHEILNVSRKIG